MPSGYMLGSTVVDCEGYDTPADPYFLKGSCQLQYEVKTRALSSVLMRW